MSYDDRDLINQKQRIWKLVNQLKDDFNAINNKSGNYVNFDEEAIHFGTMMTHKDMYKVAMRLEDMTITNAFLQVAYWGLTSDSDKQRVYFCPRSRKLRLGYRGVSSLLQRHDCVKSIIYQLVHESDEFKAYKPNEPVTHSFNMLSDATRGDICGGYFELTYTDNTYAVCFLSKEELEAHATIDGAKNAIYNGPYYKEMLTKCLIHRAYKHLEPQLCERSGRRSSFGVIQESYLHDQDHTGMSGTDNE